MKNTHYKNLAKALICYAIVFILVPLSIAVIKTAVNQIPPLVLDGKGPDKSQGDFVCGYGVVSLKTYKQEYCSGKELINNFRSRSLLPIFDIAFPVHQYNFNLIGIFIIFFNVAIFALMYKYFDKKSRTARTQNDSKNLKSKI